MIGMRLFAGLEPSPAFRDALARLQENLRAAGITGRFLGPDNLHMTLAYIGMWPEVVTEVLPAVEQPFQITLVQAGVFPASRVLWAGIRPSGALDRLADQVRHNLSAAGIPFDPQPFRAHITLVRKPSIPETAALPDIKVPPASMTVREVCLYRSEHLESGMAYTVIGRGQDRSLQERPLSGFQRRSCGAFPMASEMSENIIGKVVRGTIDRPMGSAHPDYPDLIYPVNYGYVEGILAADGEEQDVYVLGADKPLETFAGRVIAIYHRTNDKEDKWIVSLDGRDYSDGEILAAIDFQERYFQGVLIRHRSANRS